MPLFPQIAVATCPQCATRVTVSGRRPSPRNRPAATRIRCPVCTTEVLVAIPSHVDPGGLCLIGYERPGERPARLN